MSKSKLKCSEGEVAKYETERRAFMYSNNRTTSEVKKLASTDPRGLALTGDLNGSKKANAEHQQPKEYLTKLQEGDRKRQADGLLYVVCTQ